MSEVGISSESSKSAVRLTLLENGADQRTRVIALPEGTRP